MQLDPVHFKKKERKEKKEREKSICHILYVIYRTVNMSNSLFDIIPICHQRNCQLPGREV